jgi:hypothetical protein
MKKNGIIQIENKGAACDSVVQSEANTHVWKDRATNTG